MHLFVLCLQAILLAGAFGHCLHSIACLRLVRWLRSEIKVGTDGSFPRSFTQADRSTLGEMQRLNRQCRRSGFWTLALWALGEVIMIIGLPVHGVGLGLMIANLVVFFISLIVVSIGNDTVDGVETLRYVYGRY